MSENFNFFSKTLLIITILPVVKCQLVTSKGDGDVKWLNLSIQREILRALLHCPSLSNHYCTVLARKKYFLTSIKKTLHSRSYCVSRFEAKKNKACYLSKLISREKSLPDPNYNKLLICYY